MLKVVILQDQIFKFTQNRGIFLRNYQQNREKSEFSRSQYWHWILSWLIPEMERHTCCSSQ